MEFAIGNLVAQNPPLEIEYALDILSECTLFAPVLWIEEKGWRDVKPGEIAPPGIIPSRWVDEHEFLLYICDSEIAEAFGKTWMLFVRKPTNGEYQAIQWRED